MRNLRFAYRDGKRTYARYDTGWLWWKKNIWVYHTGPEMFGDVRFRHYDGNRPVSAHWPGKIERLYSKQPARDWI